MPPRPSRARSAKTAKIRDTDWAWASCSAANPFPGTPDPTQICLKNGFDPALLYQVVFTAKDPYVLGVGLRRVPRRRVLLQERSPRRRRYAQPAGRRASRGSSAAGVRSRGTSSEAFCTSASTRTKPGGRCTTAPGRSSPGRRIALNFRFAMPDGVLKLYEPGSEGPQWWVPWPDPVRDLPTRGILDRCTASHTCPKVVEHFGAAEVWGAEADARNGWARRPMPTSR